MSGENNNPGEGEPPPPLSSPPKEKENTKNDPLQVSMKQEGESKGGEQSPSSFASIHTNDDLSLSESHVSQTENGQTKDFENTGKEDLAAKAIDMYVNQGLGEYFEDWDTAELVFTICDRLALSSVSMATKNSIVARLFKGDLEEMDMIRLVERVIGPPPTKPESLTMTSKKSSDTDKDKDLEGLPRTNVSPDYDPKNLPPGAPKPYREPRKDPHYSRLNEHPPDFNRILTTSRNDSEYLPNSSHDPSSLQDNDLPLDQVEIQRQNILVNFIEMTPIRYREEDVLGMRALATDPSINFKTRLL